jgi:vanillate O-demethylase ferredoxin subunit
VKQPWIPAVVARARLEAQDVRSFELVRPDGGELPSFTPGSHIDVVLKNGLIRQYSLCNASSERHRYVIGVLREPQSRGGSVALFDDLDEGDSLRISAPRNHFGIASEARAVLLFAGGIGITPILCMARELAHRAVPFQLFYACRSRSRAAFVDQIGHSAFAQQTHLHFDDESAGSTLDLAAILRQPQPDGHLYVCGPPGFIKAVLDTAARSGWPPQQLHREHFQSQPEASPTAVDGFSVRIASTGATYYIPPDRPVIDVLREHGIAIPVSCEQGVCGTCVTGILEGMPEHHDMFMTDQEHAQNNCFTPCCSRAKTPLLVLDL